MANPPRGICWRSLRCYLHACGPGLGLLTYCGGHQQSYFPAPRGTFRHFAFAVLFRLPVRIYCNSEPVKSALLTTGIGPGRVVPIPHFSTHYVQFEPVALPAPIEEFCRRHEGVFFVYLCFRREYMLEFLASVMKRFRASFPKIGFLLVGTSSRELPPLTESLRRQQLEDAVWATGSVPHDLFLTLMQRSLAYIRPPLTDGVCASVMEGLALKVPVLASNNGTRPPGVETWDEGDADQLLELMTKAATARDRLVAQMPDVTLDDNTARLADDIEKTCDRFRDNVCLTASEVSSSTRVRS